ncbi:Zn(II)2Cys6 transcription factor domain-containing protein [Aspergillus candidus]|uniref:Zn(2)-C6 fungal-type domain-containing protein n=1 Tax=Aspergillus candidus TaxID=41067 RepID=A0A2I2F5E7_ASPCN|nr:hypothetical protein BDW47DRAFT_133219 [Aspergillus candidus]PLB35831.1 hypothetical protein BDW47DRAFT_133219 [Aspergillus candidus]
MAPPHATDTVVMTNNAKRYACDRCRDLKLRCPRNCEDAPCDRCLRVDARCVTSSGRPLGRPSNHSESHVDMCRANHHTQYKRKRAVGVPKTMVVSDAAGIPPNRGPDKSIDAPYVPTDLGPSPFNGMLAMELDGIHGPYDLPEPTAGLTYPSGLGSGFPVTGSGDSLHVVDSPPWWAAGRDSPDRVYTDNSDISLRRSIPALDEFCNYDLGPPDMVPSLCREPPGSDATSPDIAMTNSNHRHSNDTRSTAGRPNSDWTPPLMNALGRISHQLAELRAQACDLSSQPVGACTFQGITPNLEFLDTELGDDTSDASSLRIRLLGKAVVATMRFTLVLQMMAPSPVDWASFVGDDHSSGSAEDITSRPMSSRSSPAPASAANSSSQVTLITLSTYLQLGELFDIILSPTVQFLDSLANATLGPCEPTGKTAMLPTPPNLSQRASGMGGTEASSSASASGVARPRSQDILITIRVVEHQLHTLEKVIGLPAEYCIVGRQDMPSKDMCGGDASVLAKAVMRQALDTLRSLKKTLDCIKTAVRRQRGRRLA